MSPRKKAGSVEGRSSWERVGNGDRPIQQLLGPHDNWSIPHWPLPLACMNRALPVFWSLDKMTSCGDARSSWIPTPAAPQGSLGSVAAKCCSVESSRNKAVLLLKLKSFPWLIVPVVSLLAICSPFSPPSPLPVPPSAFFYPLILHILFFLFPCRLWFFIIVLLNHDKPNRKLPKWEALGS